MDHSTPANISIGKYRQHVMKDWEALLDDQDVNEEKVQKFLEMHPSMLPFNQIPLAHGNYHPLSEAVVSQPVLSGLKAKVPDFLYFTGNSGEITAVLIEIECPSKTWFTKKGQQTATLTQAANQIKTWKTWFSDPVNIQAFERDYLVRNYGPLNERTFKQEYILVIGRRKDIPDPTLNKTRHHLQGPSETWMTYDRLTFSPHWKDAVTVKLSRSGVTPEFRVLHVPPMIKLGPHHYPNYRKLSDLEDAIKANRLISKDRKNFLLTRLPYWENWYSQNNTFATLGPDFAGE